MYHTHSLRRRVPVSAGLIAMLLGAVVLFFVHQPAGGWGAMLAAYDQQMRATHEQILERFHADNIAIQKMDASDVLAVNRAQGESIERNKQALNATNNEWQRQVQNLHRNMYVSQFLFVVGLLLLVAGFLVTIAPVLQRRPAPLTA